MKAGRIIVAVLAFILCAQVFVRAQEMDTEISNLATNLASAIKNQGKKKVAVIDFTDLEGSSSDLGKYVAEQLTVDLVMVRQDFAVLDRGNLRKILAEHKLTATGLVDPDNAKKLGQFAGVDAIILGTLTAKKQNVSVTAKIITTDSAEIVGAAKTQFKTDDTVQQLVSKPVAESAPGSAAAPQEDKPKVVKIVGDLRVELQSLKVINGEFLLSMNLVNQNTNKSIFVAVNASTMNEPNAVIRNDSGLEFYSGPYDTGVSGIPSTLYMDGGYHGAGFSKATEIRPSDSIPATIKFISRVNRPAAPGPFKVQLELIVSHDFNNGFGHGSVNPIAAKMTAE